MRILTALVLTTCCVTGFSSNYSLLLRFDAPVDISQALADHQVNTVRSIPGEPVYRVELTSDTSLDTLIGQLYNTPGLLSAEPNQKGIITGAEPAASIDQRPMLVLDQRPMLVLDQRPMLVLDDGRLYGTDNPAAAPLFFQDWLDQIQAPQVWENATGAGVTIAILDTGIDTSHPFLEGHISSLAHDFVAGDSDPNEERSNLDSNENGALDEGWGHGTHVAGIVRLVAPGAEILPIRVIDSDGVGNLFNILEGLEYALNSGADVINLSLSIPEPSVLLQEWILKAKQQNVLVVTSAGNSSSGTLDFPADEMTVISVASVDQENVKSSFSNYSNKVDVSAPGERILSAHPGGNYYVERTGTSMAAPMVAAQAAIILEVRPTANFHRQMNRIKNMSQSIDYLNLSYEGLVGTGLIDIAHSIQEEM